MVVKKIFSILVSLFIIMPVSAQEIMLQCNWEQSSVEAYSGNFLKRENKSKVFILKDNKVYSMQGELLPADISDNEIKIELDNSDPKAKIIETFILNRITGNIDYREEYRAKGFLSTFRAITTGNGSCKAVSATKKF